MIKAVGLNKAKLLAAGALAAAGLMAAGAAQAQGPAGQACGVAAQLGVHTGELLRADLWSDTRVHAATCEKWGLPSTLPW